MKVTWINETVKFIYKKLRNMLKKKVTNSEFSNIPRTINNMLCEKSCTCDKTRRKKNQEAVSKRTGIPEETT